MYRITPPADEERPRLRISRRRCQAGSVEKRVDLFISHLSVTVELNRTEAPRQCWM
jgi:hypothetical protein